MLFFFIFVKTIFDTHLSNILLDLLFTGEGEWDYFTWYGLPCQDHSVRVPVGRYSLACTQAPGHGIF